VVEILTTDGINFSARFAKESGTAKALKIEKLKTIIVRNIFLNNLI
jgi:hypothetical protein|tara:strand:- start:1223 stop:1360 length:138 start_codon:yes stop_codon:yes gene_type:complete